MTRLITTNPAPMAGSVRPLPMTAYDWWVSAELRRRREERKSA